MASNGFVLIHNRTLLTNKGGCPYIQSDEFRVASGPPDSFWSSSKRAKRRFFSNWLSAREARTFISGHEIEEQR